MSVIDGSLGDIASVCVGATALAFGAPPPGVSEALLGTAGIISFMLGRRATFGPECSRVRRSIQTRIAADYRELIGGADGTWAAGADLEAADEALRAGLGKCVLDRKRLAAAAVTSEGFPEGAVTVVLDGLAEARPDLFGPGQRESLPYRFARDVVRTGIEAAVEDADYYRQLEPHLMFEMARSLGGVREVLDDQSVLLRRIADKLGIALGGDAAETEVARLETALNATRAELLALLTDIIGQGITPDRAEAALPAAKASLERSRAELERLRSLANEVPEIEPHLIAARRALDLRDSIDLGAAQAAIRAAREQYQQAVAARHAAEAVNMARLLEAEASIALARSDLLEAARLFAEAAAGLPDAEGRRAAQLRQRQAETLIRYSDAVPSLDRVREAVAVFRSAIAVYAGTEDAEDWAICQANLGVALRRLGESEGGRSGGRSLKEAATAFEAAAAVFSAQHKPLFWAQVQSNLGNVLRILGERGVGKSGLATLRRAIAAYSSALSVFTREKQLEKWANTRNNLGNVYKRLAEREAGDARRANIELAIAAYTDGLAFGTRETRPTDWAMTQNNLGVALSVLAQLEGAGAGRDTLERAIAAHAEALTVYTREERPSDWAMTQVNLGATYRNIALIEAGDASRHALRRAVAMYHEALTVYRADVAPVYWATVQVNLGHACSGLGGCIEGDEGRAMLVAASEAYQQGLTVFNKADMPRHWGTARQGLAEVQAMLSERPSSGASL